jgi:heat shock protein HslJ
MPPNDTLVPAASPHAPACKAGIAAAGLAAAALLGACAAPADRGAAAGGPLEVGGLWRVAQARTEPIMDRSRARLDFGADGLLAGHTSCNAFSARYRLVGMQFKVDAIRTAGKVCRGLLAEQEDRILSALEAATTARVRPDGLLELRDEDGRGVLRGLRFDSENPP